MHPHAHGPDRSAPERAALTGAIAASGLVLLKLVTGIVTGSLGMLAEAAHSLADVASSLIALWSIRLANRPPDREHPFGHGKVEHLTALGEALGLLIVGVGIGAIAVNRILGDAPGPHHAWAAIVVSIIVIGVDVWRYTVATRAAKIGDSAALQASAIHFGSDLMGSAAVLVGLGLVAMGEPKGDAFAAAVVAVMIVIASLRLGWGNIQELMDRVPAEAEQAARRAVHQMSDRVQLRRLRIRRSAFRYLADVVIAAPGVEHIQQAHRLADEVEQAIEAALPGSDVVVHVEPGEPTGGIRDKVLAAAQSVPGVHEVHNVRVVDVEGELEVSMHLKFPAHWSLQAAHEAANKVEREVQQDVPNTSRITTHLEPIAEEVVRAKRVEHAQIEQDIIGIAEAAAGEPPTDVHLRYMGDRLTVLVTITCQPQVSLRDAHAMATRVENEVCVAHPEIDEVVVHVEPATAAF